MYLIASGTSVYSGYGVTAAKVQIGENIVVFGLGGIGLTDVQGTKLPGIDFTSLSISLGVPAELGSPG